MHLCWKCRSLSKTWNVWLSILFTFHHLVFYFSHHLNPLVFCFSLELVVSSGSVLNTWTIELFWYRKVNVAKYNHLQASKAPFSISFSSCFSSASLFCGMDAVQLSLTLDCQQFLLKANNPIFMLQVTCIPIQCCTHEGNNFFLKYYFCWTGSKCT